MRHAKQSGFGFLERFRLVEEAHYQLGIALRESGDVANAEQSLRQAVSLDPRHARAHAALGRLLAQRGDHTNAAPELRRASELAPCSADTHRESP